MCFLLALEKMIVEVLVEEIGLGLSVISFPDHNVESEVSFPTLVVGSWCRGGKKLTMADPDDRDPENSGEINPQP